MEGFEVFQKELDEKYNRWERIVKLSRSITIESKRMIFHLQRINLNDSVQTRKIQQEIQPRLLSISQMWKEVATELKDEQHLLYLPAFSAGLEEYIEAMAFSYYFEVKDRIKPDSFSTAIIPIEKIRSFLHFTDEENPEKSTSVCVPVFEYLMGLADATGEFMRMCVNSAAKANSEESRNELFRLCSLLRYMYEMFVSFSPLLNNGFGGKKRNVQNKLNVMKASLQKVEDVCYMLEIRSKEFPQHQFKENSWFDFSPDYLKN